MLECIYCSSQKISKSIMSPMVSGLGEMKNDFKEMNKLFKSEKDQLIKLRKYVEKNFEYVGNDFSKKVREIYYDKSSKKTIYGTTTSKEREELREEGINLISVPWVEKDN